MTAFALVPAARSMLAVPLPAAVSGRGPYARVAAAPAQARNTRTMRVEGGAALLGPGTLAGLVGSVAAATAARRRSAPNGARRSGAAWRSIGRLSCAATGGAELPVVLDVKGVEARSTDDEAKEILKGLNLTIREGEVHAVMGPNGSGKSTLSRVLIGDRAYEVTAGSACLGGKNLFDLEPHERALEGMFLAFQSPPAVNGVSNLDFLRASYNAQRRARKETELDVIEFYGLVTEKLQKLKVDPDFLNRNVNEGFSGGERKRNEMLQMSVLEPRLAILDEIDSGLDIDALKDVADAIGRVREADKKRSILMVTHFERFLKYVDADFIHVMHRGRIIKSGGREIADRLDKEGYDWVINEVGA